MAEVWVLRSLWSAAQCSKRPLQAEREIAAKRRGRSEYKPRNLNTQEATSRHSAPSACRLKGINSSAKRSAPIVRTQSSSRNLRSRTLSGPCQKSHPDRLNDRKASTLPAGAPKLLRFCLSLCVSALPTGSKCGTPLVRRRGVQAPCGPP